jgi:hypothetical protein
LCNQGPRKSAYKNLLFFKKFMLPKRRIPGAKKRGSDEPDGPGVHWVAGR